ncbi:MAG TPA: M48 family metallopeptidase [Burkholderiales bacterium]|nr:M48 family metallopeptidase [Burkholderiales bacterium]
MKADWGTISRHAAAAACLAFGLAAPAGAASLFDRLLDNPGIVRDATTAVVGINEQEEIAIGRELAGRTLGAARLVNDPELQAYVNRVGRWIAAQSERQELPWRFGVIDTASVNAFAAPGGFILVTRGLYDMLENESQLAGVLGHEIGHVVRRHHVTVLQKSAAVSAGSQALQRDNRMAFVNQLIGTGAEVFTRALDKDAEYEADALGVVLALRAGYTPQGLTDVLGKLQARGASDDAMQLLFATHPAPGDRLQRLNDAMSPRLANLPQGVEPNIRTVSASAGTAPASTGAMPRGARALSAESEPAPAPAPAPARSGGSGGGSGLPVDPGQLLRGIFGR